VYEDDQCKTNIGYYIHASGYTSAELAIPAMQV